MSTPLLICADDFGYAPAVNEGIAELVMQGRVTATSCLTMSPHWPEAAAVARTLEGRADLGLHLDLTEFARHASLPRLLIAGRLGLLSRGALRERIATQLSRFEDGVGAAPDYIDGHQHVHQVPEVARLLIDELVRRYAASLPWVRVSAPAAGDLKSRIIAATGAAQLRRLLDDAGLRHTTRLLGVYDFRDSPAWLDRVAGWLNEVRPGDALMVHPSLRAVAGDPLSAARVREFEGLSSVRFGTLLTQCRVSPARGSSLALPVAA